MITPRHTRLVRVPDLHTFRSTVAALVSQHLTAFSAPPLVIVPTHAAGRHLERDPQRSTGTTDHTRRDVRRLSRATTVGAERLNAFERDAMMQAAAKSVSTDVPFTIRPGLVSQMVRFYDDLRRHAQTVARFEELMEAKLAGADVDRGAERLLRQTRFLAAAFRRYELAVSEAEHATNIRFAAGCSLRTLLSPCPVLSSPSLTGSPMRTGSSSRTSIYSRGCRT